MRGSGPSLSWRTSNVRCAPKAVVKSGQCNSRRFDGRSSTGSINSGTMSMRLPARESSATWASSRQYLEAIHSGEMSRNTALYCFANQCAAQELIVPLLTRQQTSLRVDIKKQILVPLFSQPFRDRQSLSVVAAGMADESTVHGCSRSMRIPKASCGHCVSRLWQTFGAAPSLLLMTCSGKHRLWPV